ncbi:DUF5658 family protein [Halanaerobacter jeridensis]|uniref:DUF5658 domain-containing protein n=1 Tax=Halanaerobacter jeridensis TaxID=706427 RepID=A0A938XUH4_9FIRM|nr:hypothetical protein [Halanaerobacter jeridensis]
MTKSKILLIRFSLLLLILFNISDYFFTTFYLKQGYQEINPIINAVLHFDIRLFQFLKLLAVPSLLLILMQDKTIKKLINHKFILYSYLIIFYFYFLLTIYYTTALINY